MNEHDTNNFITKITKTIDENIYTEHKDTPTQNKELLLQHGKTVILSGGSPLQQRIAAKYIAICLSNTKNNIQKEWWNSEDNEPIITSRDNNVMIIDNYPFSQDFKGLLNQFHTRYRSIFECLVIGSFGQNYTGQQHSKSSTKNKPKKGDEGFEEKIYNRLSLAVKNAQKGISNDDDLRFIDENVKNIEEIQQTSPTYGLSRIGIPRTREWIAWATLAPQGNRKFRIAGLLAAHTLTESASNALLKTLEEPPPSTFCILGAPDIHNLLSTVRSRGLIIDLGSTDEFFRDPEVLSAITYIGTLFERLGPNDQPYTSPLRRHPNWVHAHAFPQNQSHNKPPKLPPRAFILIEAARRWLRNANFYKHDLPVAEPFRNHPLTVILAELSTGEMKQLLDIFTHAEKSLKHNVSQEATSLLILMSIDKALMKSYRGSRK